MEKEKKINKVGIIVPVIFAVIIFLICVFIFIADIKYAYSSNTGGGFIPESFVVVVKYFWVWAIGVILAPFIALILAKRVKILPMLAVALLAPILTYQICYHGFKGPLLPLVEKGGIFHFIAIGDYNFDGMNDKEYHILYDERTTSTGYSTYESEEIGSVSCAATGTGKGLSGCFSFYYPDKKQITVFVPKNDVTIRKIVLTIRFKESSYKDKMKLYFNELNFDTKGITYGIEGDNMVITFNEEACMNAQKAAERTRNEVKIKYSF